MSYSELKGLYHLRETIGSGNHKLTKKLCIVCNVKCFVIVWNVKAICIVISKQNDKALIFVLPMHLKRF